MRAGRLQNALDALKQATREVESALEELRGGQDPLALHIFVSRRNYRRTNDTKGGARRETYALISFKEATELGFRGQLSEWQRLLGAVPRR